MACLFWPAEPYRDDRSILVAGCGTSQAAKVALLHGWCRLRRRLPVPDDESAIGSLNAGRRWGGYAVGLLAGG
jgi:hypothetical protein